MLLLTCNAFLFLKCDNNFYFPNQAFELAVAGLISHPLNVWFATALTEEGLKRISSFKIMRNKASRDRTLPKCPVSMRGVIRIKKFTNGAVSYTLTFFKKNARYFEIDPTCPDATFAWFARPTGRGVRD